MRLNFEFGAEESIGGFPSETSLQTLGAFPSNAPHTDLAHTPTHETGESKFLAGTYGFILGGPNLKTTKGRDNPLDQPCPLMLVHLQA